MRTKKVNRYYCDFCKKSNCSASAISKHERGCTANPNRVCSMHKHCEGEQKPMADLVGCLTSHGTDKDWTAGMVQLREMASNCPACILAAIRQSELQKLELDEEGINHGPQFDFDFKKELAEFWSVVNDVAYQNQNHGDY